MNKTIYGNVVQIQLNTQVAKKAGGTYPGWKMIYNTPDGKTETIAKHINSLKYKPQLAAVLNTLAQGDDFTMGMVKEGDYWEVESIAKGMDMPAVDSGSSGGYVGPKREYKTDKSSTYETADERALRQALIVRRSSLASAISALPNGKPSEHIKLAKQYEDFVWNGYESFKAKVVTPSEAAEVE